MKSGRLGRQPPESGYQGGLSLVELMVSMAISLVILGAVVGLFINTSNRNQEFARTNGMIEHARLAVELLSSDVIHGGFWGSHVPEFDDQTSGTVPVDAPTAIPDPCAAYDAAVWDEDYEENLIGIPVQVYEDVPGTCTALLTDKQADTDILLVRHAETCVPGGSANCEADIAGKLYFQPSRCLTDVARYRLDTSGFDLTQRDCTTLAEKRKFVSNIYYVRDYAVTPGDGIPTLMRSRFDVTPAGTLAPLAPEPLIEGIEAFRVELGIDDVSRTGDAVDYSTAVAWVDPELRTEPVNRGDGVPDDAYLTCTTLAPCGVGDLSNVTAVRLHVLARSLEPSPGYTDTKTYTLGDLVVGPRNDGFKRHVFVTTVELPNFAGRRMTP